MTPETEETVFHGEILPPDFPRGAAEFHAHEAFDELARVYGRKQAAELWDEVGGGTIQKIRDIMTEWNFGPVPDRDALDAIIRIVGDNIQREA